MARFLLILAPEHPRRGELSAAAVGRRTGAFASWIRRLEAGGALRGATRLLPDGARLTRPGLEHRCSERGPATPVSGCLVVEASDLDAAVALAAGCPGIAPGCIDVLEVDRGTERGAFEARGP